MRVSDLHRRRARALFATGSEEGEITKGRKMVVSLLDM